MRAFETRHGIALPEGYRRFVLEIGNGGAGPFYGLFPLGDHTAALTGDDTPGVLARPACWCRAWPWTSGRPCARLGLDDDAQSADAYRQANAALHGGVMSLGDQGCGILHALVVSGPFAGRVVNLNDEVRDHPPLFAFEPDFLAWYERWLDETISGELIESEGWFGYVPGGDPGDLLAGFVSCRDERDAADFLDGLGAKRHLHPAIVGVLLRHEPASAAQRAAICRVVCKSDFARARPLLDVLAQESPKSFLQCLLWHAGDALTVWQEVVLSPQLRIDDDETFVCFGLVLAKLDVDRGAYLAPHTRSDRKHIRATAFHGLGKLKNKSDDVDCFALGLADDDTAVVRNSLQALAGVRDPALLPHYRRLAERFPVERDYLRANLGHRLREFGLSLDRVHDEPPPPRPKTPITPTMPARPPARPASRWGRLADAWRRLTRPNSAIEG